MPRWILVLVLALLGMPFAGCGDPTPDSTASSSPSSGDEQPVGDVLPPPPPPSGSLPPPPPPPSGSPTLGSSDISAANRLDAAYEALIPVLSQLGSVLSDVTDADSAKAKALQYLTLSRRKEKLEREIVLLKLQLGDQGNQRTQKYSSRVRVAAQKSATAQRRLFGDLQMMTIWGKALREAGKDLPPEPSLAGQDGDDSLVSEWSVLLNQASESIRQIVDLLSSVNDETTARAAAEGLSQCTDTLKHTGKRLKLVVAALSPQEKRRLPRRSSESEQEVRRTARRLDEEIVRVAASPASRVIQSEINQLLGALEEVQPRKRERLQKLIQKERNRR